MTEATPDETFEDIKAISDTKERKLAMLRLLKELDDSPSNAPIYAGAKEIFCALPEEDEKRAALHELIISLPMESYFLDIYHDIIFILLDSAERIEGQRYRKSQLLRIASEIPLEPEFFPLFKDAINRTITASNACDELFVRRYALFNIAERLPLDEEFTEMRYRALSLALGLSDEAPERRDSWELLAFELPKVCDYTFFVDNTFLGIAIRMPKTGVFRPLYMQAIEIALEASDHMEEPYFKKYALLYIAKSLPKEEVFEPLYRRALEKTCEAAMDIRDPFINHITVLEILEVLPKTEAYYPLILTLIEKVLPFYSVKSRIDDVALLDVIDYIIIAEERKIGESKKNRYTRESYARTFAKVLLSFGLDLTDVRFIEPLKPYTHVWIKPPELREAASKVVNHLEGLKTLYHGAELLRPLMVSEKHRGEEGLYRGMKEDATMREASDTIVIDIGASNTIIMKKRLKGRANYVEFNEISRRFGDVVTIPTVYNERTDTIGTAALEDDASRKGVNIKKLLIGGNPRGRDQMAHFFNLLFERIKEELQPRGWRKIISSAPSETFYITVPVGLTDYKNRLKDIITAEAKGIQAEFIEEPLAAAIGYQVAEESEKLVMLMDFGGCTLDVMALRISSGTVHVVAKPDRSQLVGGQDIDYWLAEYLGERAELSVIGSEPHAALIKKAEALKIALSSHHEVPFVWEGSELFKVTLQDFEELLQDRDFYRTVDRAASFVLAKCAKVGIKTENFEAVLLTGGSSQIPSFKEKVGHLFPALRRTNAIYDHSPLSAVATGAAYYGTRDVVDRHLAIAYAVKYVTGEKKIAHELILEKGEPLPFERTFRADPAQTLGEQNQISIELYEIPDALITRRWELTGGFEYIKQVIKESEDTEDIELKPLKIITLPYNREITGEEEVTFVLDETGRLKIKYDKGKEVDSGIRLQ